MKQRIAHMIFARRKMRDVSLNRKLALIVLGILLLVFFLAGCTSSRDSVTADEFIVAAEELSFEVHETPMDEIEHLIDVGLVNSLSANRGTASVVFDIYINEDSARANFDFYSNGVVELFPSPQLEEIDGRSAWDLHQRRSSTALVVAVRVDGTVLGASAETAEDVAAVDALIAAIGY
jgi:hypothetical protein